ncbi:UNVERIFIED_CONTAM: hypothetical protein H355_007220 [Colinus virginianus]|nr:hypothetical protein H355_007220 [Colinus virginianus]
MLQERTLRLQPGSRIHALCVLGTHIATDVYGPSMVLQASWTWGPEGHGAILLVTCDRDSPLSPAPDCDDERVFSKEGQQSCTQVYSCMHPDLLDMSRMMLRMEGPLHLPRGYEIVLYVHMSDADKVGVFHVQNPFFRQHYVHVLGRRKLCHIVKYSGGAAELEFFVEGLQFPDESFPGLISIHVSLLETLAEGIPLSPIFTDTVVFRVAPWIMMPNTLAPENVFVCSVKDNYLYIKEIKNLVNKAGCDLKVCFGYINRGDRWMQDEIEFGYTQAPHKSFAVVLDSPQDTGLEQFPIKELLQVQAPVELFSDWLAMGHVNEFVTFVPSPDAKRFRMLMASPAACYKLFRQKQKEGLGEATMFKGKRAAGSLGRNVQIPARVGGSLLLPAPKIKVEL